MTYLEGQELLAQIIRKGESQRECYRAGFTTSQAVYITANNVSCVTECYENGQIALQSAKFYSSLVQKHHIVFS